MKYFLLLLALLFTSCSPRYEIKTLYAVPTNFQGKQGVKGCLAEKRECQTRCNQRQDRCLAKAREVAKDEFVNVKNEYKVELRHYNLDMKKYEKQMRELEHQERRLESDIRHYTSSCDTAKPKSYACRQLSELRSDLRELTDTEPDEPSRPSQPSLSQEIRQAQASCSNECGCDKAYDTCFTSNGGTIRYERFCVENCKER